jgi:short subunit dehydrogenase-like uncharacterized protein
VAGASTADQAGPIVVYGASGYTGRLICGELDQRGADFVLAGRSRERLERAAAELGGEHAVAAVALDDGPGLRELVGGAAAVIGCAGPFTLHGEPLIAAAAETGTNYLDTTGEQPFIRAAFERWGAPAERSGAALLSGFGFDYAPGDMLAALTADGLGKLEEMRIAYSISNFGATRGTARSALEMMKGGDAVWRDGELVTAPRHVGMGNFGFPSPLGSRRVGRYPSGEPVTVPRHVDVRSLDVVIDLRGLTGLPLGPLGAPAMTAGGMLMATPLRGAGHALIGRLPEGPSPRQRQAARFTIVCSARHAGGERRGILRGSDIYGITAITLAEGALRMAAPGYDRTGALAPSQAFEPAGFLRHLEPFGVWTEIEPVGR